MDKKQFALLFAAMVSIYTVGMGLHPLLPVYALQLGARPALVGYYLAFNSLMISIGLMGAGWLSDRTGRRKLWLLLSIIIAPATLVAMAGTRNFWALVAWNGLLWFTGGLAIGISLAMVGLHATKQERGKWFGILATASPLGTMIGGAALGPAADQWGYPTMIRLVAMLYALALAFSLPLDDPRHKPSPARQDPAARERPPRGLGLGAAFYYLFLSSLIMGVGGSVVGIVRSLAMDRAGYGAAAISSTSMVAGIVSLPFSPLAGWLSDRLGRKRLVVGSCAISLIGRSWLVVASRLWEFRGALGLNAVAGVADALRSAWVSDLAPRESLGRALSIVRISSMASGVIGYTLAGLLVERLGIPWTFGVAALSSLVGIALLIPIRMAGAQPAPPPAAGEAKKAPLGV